MDNSVEIFSIALGLKSPWSIEKLIFDKETSQLDIYIRFTKGHKFLMPDESLYSLHDAVKRKWQHLNFFQHKCYLHAKVPRVKQADGKTIIQTVP